MRLMVDADHLQTIHDIVYPSTQRLRPYLTEEATSLVDSQYSQRGLQHAGHTGICFFRLLPSFFAAPFARQCIIMATNHALLFENY